MINPEKLKGGVIQEVVETEGESKYERWIVMLVTKGKKVYQVDVARDEECNGPGALLIGEREDLTPEDFKK